LRLHAHDQIKEFFSLNDLRRSLSAHGCLDHGFDIGDVYAITRDLLAVDVD
jgi:hypothetical protein